METLENIDRLLSSIETAQYAQDLWKEGKSLESVGMYDLAILECQDKNIRDQMILNCGLICGEHSGPFPNYPKALEYLDQISPDSLFYDQARWNISLFNLHLGNWEKGIQHYHYRHSKGNSHEPTSVRFPDLPLPRAENLSDLQHKTVLILNEQGFGDEIMFSTAFEALKNVRMDHCFIQCYPELHDFFVNAFAAFNFNFFSKRQLPYDFVMKFDVWTTTGDLFAMANRKTLKPSVPISITTYYDETEDDMFLSGLRKVGVCFSANKKSPNHHLRDIPLTYVNKVITQVQEHGGIVVCLQKDDVPEGLIPLPENATFGDTAKWMQKLDHVVTADTCIAHLAGRLGIPTTVVYTNYLGWLWKYQNENGSNILYPSITTEKIS